MSQIDISSLIIKEAKEKKLGNYLFSYVNVAVQSQNNIFYFWVQDKVVTSNWDCEESIVEIIEKINLLYKKDLWFKFKKKDK